jgi:hypothetical protein
MLDLLWLTQRASARIASIRARRGESSNLAQRLLPGGYDAGEPPLPSSDAPRGSAPFQLRSVDKIPRNV